MSAGRREWRGWIPPALRRNRAALRLREVWRAIMWMRATGPFIAETRAQAAFAGVRPGASIMVFGPARIGKTRVCRIVADAMGWQYVDADRLVAGLYRGVDAEGLRHWCLRLFLRRLLRAVPEGACIDCPFLLDIFTADPGFLVRIAGKSRLYPVSSRAPVAERLRAMRHQRASLAGCWTLGRVPEGELRAFAEQIVRSCGEVDAVCQKLGLRPVLVEPGDFDRSAHRAARTIVAGAIVAGASRPSAARA